METQHYNRLSSFIWNIATDVLVHAFEKGDYKKIILPFTVLRRIDVLLEGTKAKALEKKAFCDRNKLPYEQFLPPVTGYPFYNVSAFTMSSLKNEIDPQRLKMNVLDWFNGFSADVQDIIDKFQLRHWTDALTAKGRLGSILEKFTDPSVNLSVKPVLDDDGNVLLPALDNHAMGTMFEELLRRFNEENNVTEAGEHFTPRDFVRLLARLAVEPVKGSLKDGTYTIYDGASGTGGILTVTQEEFAKVAAETGRKIKTMIFGQELQDDTYATCKADLMISGTIRKFTYRLGSADHPYIACGSTISQDGHAGEKFDFCVMNPPFGTPWKEDLKNWGVADKKEVSDPRFFDGETSFLPDVGDCQMLFLANSVSRMKDTPLGTRIVEVHNGSSLFTGSAGGGESNLRRHIIENDMLEAIVAMPEKAFYNTGIGTYVWIVTNRKEPRRRGKVQLIDATAISTPLKKNLGEKNCETSEADCDRILKLLTDFKETPESKIFPNEEFGYWEVPVLRPKRGAEGKPVLKKGKPVLARSRGEFEQIPITYPGGIEAFYEKEVKPYDPEAVFGEPVLGYEISFTKYFYKPVELRPAADITADLRALESETAGLLDRILEDRRKLKQAIIAEEVTGGTREKTRPTGVFWQPTMPDGWRVRKLRHVLKKLDRARKEGAELLVCTNKGEVVKRGDAKIGLVSEDESIYQGVAKGDLLIHGMDTWHGAIAVSDLDGMCTPVVHVCDSSEDKHFIAYCLQNMARGRLFKLISNGVRQNTSDFRSWEKVAQLPIVLPPLDEQRAIVAHIEAKTAKIDALVAKLGEEVARLKEYRERLIADAVTGKRRIAWK